jgi:hypothetical protein
MNDNLKMGWTRRRLVLVGDHLGLYGIVLVWSLATIAVWGGCGGNRVTNPDGVAKDVPSLLEDAFTVADGWADARVVVADTASPVWDAARGADADLVDGDGSGPGCAPSLAHVRVLARLPEEVTSQVVMTADERTLFIGAFRPLSPAGTPVVWAVAKDTGTLGTIWTGDAVEGIGGLAVDGEVLYFTTESRVLQIPKTGGNAQTLATGQSIAGAIALAPTFIYWASSGVLPDWRGGVFRLPRTGGPVQQLAELVRASGIYVDEVYAYTGAGTSATMAGGLIRLPLAGGPSLVLNSAGGSSIVGNTTELFTVSSYTLDRVEKSTGVASTLYSNNAGGHSLALDAEYVYWTSQGIWGGVPAVGAGKVLKAPLGGGDVQEVAICQAKPSAIAVDGSSVYWLNWVTGEIIQAPK